MKIFIRSIALCFLCLGKSFGQNKVLTGKVASCKYEEPIENVTMRLVGSDGTNVEVITDSNGIYVFDELEGVPYINAGHNYVLSTEAKGAKLTKYEEAFLNSSEKYKFSADSLNIGKNNYDFCLVEATHCYMRFPYFFFPFDGIIFSDSLSKDQMDKHPVEFTVGYLKDNPNLIVEIGGHASYKEKRTKELGLKRAQAVRDSLINSGISEERLVVVSYGSTKPFQLGYNVYLDKEFINKLPTEEERKAARQRNQRVSIRIKSWDYTNPNAPAPPPIVKPKVYGQEEGYEEED